MDSSPVDSVWPSSVPGFSFDRGMANLRSALEAAGIEYETTTVESGGEEG